MAEYTIIEKHKNLSGRYAQVMIGDQKFHTGVERGKSVRIAYRGRARGWKWNGFVRDAQGKTIWCNYVPKSQGIRGMLISAGLIRPKTGPKGVKGANVDYLLVDRLWEMYTSEDWTDTLYETTTVEDLLKYPIQEYVPDSDHIRGDDAWNFGRVRYFYEQIQKRRSLVSMLCDPIMVDNRCSGMAIYPIPVVLDGHHRLASHRIAKVEKIPAYYSGRVDLLDYLTGKTSEKPVELWTTTPSDAPFFTTWTTTRTSNGMPADRFTSTLTTRMTVSERPEPPISGTSRAT